MLTEEEELKLRAERDALHMLTAYLLYERREETELRLAFAALVGERHHNFHDKEGEDTPFTDCGNQVCVNALAMLQTARKARIEINQLSIELMQNQRLIVRRDTHSKICVGYLEDMTAIIPPSNESMLKV